MTARLSDSSLWPQKRVAIMKTWILIALVAIVGGVATEEMPDKTLRDSAADVSKIAIESGTERLVEATRLPPVAALVVASSEPASDETEAEPLTDLSKARIESGAESLVKRTLATQPQDQQQASESPRAVGDGPDVISVKPGLVSWHKDYATAQAASQVSGKPILLFQLLGKLDEHFT